MARFVITGSLNCPYYAKLELLADDLQNKLENFKVFKKPVPDVEWATWLDTVCKKNEWVHRKSPLVWRELIERGGKGLYVGGLNEFSEYAKLYYGFESDMETPLMIDIRDENKILYSAEQQRLNQMMMNMVVTNVCIINASHFTAHHLAPMIAKGWAFGDAKLTIRLFDNNCKNKSQLDEIALQVSEMASDYLLWVRVIDNLELATVGATHVIILDDVTLAQQCEESDRDWLLKNTKYFQKIATTIDKHANKNCRVVVVGDTIVNHKTQVLQETVDNIDASNIVGCPRANERKAKSILCGKLGSHPCDLSDVIIWGDSSALSNDCFVTPAHMKVRSHDGAIWGLEWFSRELTEVFPDEKWLEEELLKEVGLRRSEACRLLGRPTSCSEASSIASLLHDWTYGSESDEIYSLAVLPHGEYGLEDVCFSLPVKFKHGKYTIVNNLKIPDHLWIKFQDILTKLQNISLLGDADGEVGRLKRKQNNFCWDGEYHENEQDKLVADMSNASLLNAEEIKHHANGQIYEEEEYPDDNDQPSTRC